MNNKQPVKVIILAGSRDFGRCILPSRLPTALGPVAGKPVLERLLNSLADQSIKQATICSNCDGALLEESIHVDACIIAVCKLSMTIAQMGAGLN